MLCAPDVSHAQALTIYDDFKAVPINPTKWWGTEQGGGATNPTTEVERIIQGGKLHITVVQYGSNVSDNGTSLGSIGLRVINPTPITTWQAKVNVIRSVVESCDTNNPPIVRARALQGGFFNDGESTGPGDRTGDIFAGIQMIHDLIGGKVIAAFVQRCPNPSCIPTTGVAVQTLFPASGWIPGQALILTVQWDKPSKQFVMTAKDTLGHVDTAHLTYPQDDSTPAVSENRQLIVQNSAVNCAGSHKQASMEASFDSVRVNP
jgi:hypothetical protein